jgi:hypothetical protein
MFRPPRPSSGEFTNVIRSYKLSEDHLTQQICMCVCVCFIATLESLQHVSAYMGHLQVIFLQIHTVAMDGFASLPVIITQQDASPPPP